MRLYDEFTTREGASNLAKDLKAQGIGSTAIKKKGNKYQVYVGGKNSHLF